MNGLLVMLFIVCMFLAATGVLAVCYKAEEKKVTTPVKTAKQSTGCKECSWDDIKRPGWKFCARCGKERSVNI